MAPGVINFVSPKGYGMATLDDGRMVFVPEKVMQSMPLDQFKDITSTKVHIGVEPALAGQRLIATNLRLVLG